MRLEAADRLDLRRDEVHEPRALARDEVRPRLRDRPDRLSPLPRALVVRLGALLSLTGLDGLAPEVALEPRGALGRVALG